MMRQVVLLGVVLALALPGIVRAQGTPDFSGTWAVSAKEPADYSGSGPRGGPRNWGAPSTMVIRQTASEITIESGQFGREPMSVVYKLDGSDTIWEAEGASQSGASAVVRWRTKARWEGDRLVLFTWNTALNQMRDIMSLSGGQLMVARATEQPGPSTNARLTYTKGP